VLDAKCFLFRYGDCFYISQQNLSEIEKKQDGLVPTILAKLTENPSKFIATMLVGNNIALVVYGFFMGDLLLVWINNFGVYFSESVTLFFQTLVSTLIVLVTAEFLPKVFFQMYACLLYTSPSPRDV
jgi:putative hemolysin